MSFKPLLGAALACLLVLPALSAGGQPESGAAADAELI